MTDLLTTRAIGTDRRRTEGLAKVTGTATYAFETSSDEGASIIKDGLAEIAEKAPTERDSA